MTPQGAHADPAGGIYAVHKETLNKSVWVTRTTPTKHYVDDIMFSLSGTASCSITAKSRSQTTSYYDYDTNYCNMYNVFRGMGQKFSTPSTTDCKWVPDDVSTCDKY